MKTTLLFMGIIVLILNQQFFPQAVKAGSDEFIISKSNTLFVGIGFPLGDFASTSANVNKAGFAKTGFSFAYELANPNYPIPGMLSLGVALNPLDEKALTKITQSEFPGYQVTVTTGSYVSVISMLGLQMELGVIPEMKLYGLAQGGVLFSYMPDWEMKINNNSAIQTFQISSSFAYELGAGVKLFNLLNVGLRYFAANTEYEASIGDTKFKMPLSTSVLQIMAGIMF